MELHAGQRITAPFLPAPAEVKTVTLRRLVHQFDPQLAGSVSQVDPLLHQTEAVYHYVLRSPRIRLFLDLLRPGFFACTELLLSSVQHGDNSIFVRRLKEDMKRFDIRSIRYNEEGTYGGIRHIEVEGRAQTGAVRSSANEWKKARHFGEDFWLYIVTGAKTDTPELHRIQNPAAQFRTEEDIQATGYIVQATVWRERSRQPAVDQGGARSTLIVVGSRGRGDDESEG